MTDKVFIFGQRVSVDGRRGTIQRVHAERHMYPRDLVYQVLFDDQTSLEPRNCWFDPGNMIALVD
jgi:hypothetical protein